MKVKVNCPQNNMDLNQGFCTSGPNLVILAWMGDELWCGQAQNWVNFYFKLNLTLIVKVDCCPKQ